MTHPVPLCGAPKRQGEGNCTQPAGWGTDHVGVGRCKLHGGCVPIKHGRYSTIKGALAEKMAKHAIDPDPASLIPELCVLRALLEGFLDKCGDKPAEAIIGAEKLIDGIRKIVDTIHKMQTRELLTTREYETALSELTRIIVEEVRDPDAIQRIAHRFRAAFAFERTATGQALLRDGETEQD